MLSLISKVMHYLLMSIAVSIKIIPLFFFKSNQTTEVFSLSFLSIQDMIEKV